MEKIREWLNNNPTGDGDGSGYGSGSGLKSINGKEIYMVDDVQTIIEHVKETFAKGYILNGDLTFTPCFVAKGQGYFAHGKTLKEAREAFVRNHDLDINAEYTVKEFIEICENDYGSDVIRQLKERIYANSLL